MGTKTRNRTAAAFTSSDVLLFDYIRKVELRLMRLERSVTMPTRARPGAAARPGRRLGAQLGVVAVRFDLYDRARNSAANGYERPTCEVGGGIEFDHPRSAKNAPGAPPVQRLDHFSLFAFARIVDNEEGCHL